MASTVMSTDGNYTIYQLNPSTSTAAVASATTLPREVRPEEPDADAAAAEPEFSDILESSLEQERQNAWEQVKSYSILLFAAAHLKSIEQDSSFFFLLAIFIAMFTATSYIKAYFVGLSAHAAKRGVTDTNRPLLSTYSLINSFLLAFITFLLVQTVMTHATPFLTEGHWSLENLVLPLALGVVLYAEWYSRTARHSSESVDVQVLFIDKTQ